MFFCLHMNSCWGAASPSRDDSRRAGTPDQITSAPAGSVIRQLNILGEGLWMLHTVTLTLFNMQSWLSLEDYISHNSQEAWVLIPGCSCPKQPWGTSTNQSVKKRTTKWPWTNAKFNKPCSSWDKKKTLCKSRCMSCCTVSEEVVGCACLFQTFHYEVVLLWVVVKVFWMF